MESVFSHLSLVGSAVSMAATVYFWLVRMRREKPCLKPYLADREFYLGLSRDEVRRIGLKVGIIVANYSVLPNAVLGARLWIRQTDGGWLEAGNIAFDKQTPQPFNIPPLHTVMLRLTGTLSFPFQDTLEDGNKTAGNYMSRHLVQPVEMKVELRHLNDRADTYALPLPAERDLANPEARAASSAAA
jgi:hypothetical protein